MSFKAGTVLLAGCYCPEHIEAAKKFMADNNLTGDDIDCKGSEAPPFGEILIIAKKEVEIRT